ncbi:MAG: adenosylcobinamide-GDP ribazoletransferase [Verrucomicrobia bacterium]|nr:adenosylcobinamide-GDP ribazoletransferase [Verrucomicrobiota bacterium]
MMPPIVRGARAAFVFLTRIPLGGWPYRPEDWRWSTAHFPLVGACLGAVLALALGWLRDGLGITAAAWLVLAISTLLTGAFHEDGLADTSDALGGAYDREKLFIILKDSRIGSFGAVALIVALGAKIALLARLDAAAPMALFVVSALARLPPIALMTLMPYTTRPDEAKSRDVARAGVAQLAVAALWTGLILAVAVWMLGLGLPALARALVVSSVVTGVLAWRFHVRAGGITGDFLGTTEQLVEVGALAALAWGVAA